MKLYAASAELAELEACLAQRLCEGIVVPAPALAVPGSRATLAALAAPDRLIFVESMLETSDAAAFVAGARELAELGPSIVVRVPFDGPAVELLRACKAAGVATNAVGCVTANEAHAAAAAGAAWISPPAPAAAGAQPVAGLDAVRKMNALLKADDQTARVLVGPARDLGALMSFAFAGAHAAFASPAILREIAARQPGAAPRDDARVAPAPKPAPPGA